MLAVAQAHTALLLHALPPLLMAAPFVALIALNIRAMSPQAGAVEIGCGSERSLVASLLHPGESRLPAGPIERIAISESLVGPWEIWFG